jgi:replication-associated recombination protein RarA
MAYVVATKPGRFEVRESANTASGPRSRTLVSFRELTAEVVEKVQARADKPPTAEELTRSALKAGAPVRGAELDEAARGTLRLMANGERPDPMLRRLLLDALSDEDRSDRPADPKARVSDAARAATQWVGVGAEERGNALRELLDLADALPVRLRPQEIGFPRLKSA